MRNKHADPIGLYQFTLGNIGYDPARYIAEPYHAHIRPLLSLVTTPARYAAEPHHATWFRALPRPLVPSPTTPLGSVCPPPPLIRDPRPLSPPYPGPFSATYAVDSACTKVCVYV